MGGTTEPMAALPDHDANARPRLTVVLITRNQAWNVARLIESVVQETAGLPATEMVLVDSDSSDETIAIASQYPIAILRLRSSRFRTPAAGRVVGSTHSTGELVLFLDGDMKLCQDWLPKALAVMQGAPVVAVVTGSVIDLAKTATTGDTPAVVATTTSPLREVPWVGGAALYRRSVLEQVGTFDPFLYSEEEPELCIRIRQAGYRIVQLDCPIAFHYTEPSGVLSTLLPRWRRNLYLGSGQILRHHFRSPVFWTYLKERGYVVGPTVALLGVAAGLIWSVHAHTWLGLALGALLVGGMIGVESYRRRLSPRQIVYSVGHRLLVVAGTLRGLCLPRPDCGGHPGTVDVVRAFDQVPSRPDAHAVVRS